MSDDIPLINIDNLTSNELKQERPALSATLRKYYTYCRRRAFATFVASKRDACEDKAGRPLVWSCCGQTYTEPSFIHKHVAAAHESELKQRTKTTFNHLLSQMESEEAQFKTQTVVKEPVDVTLWVPDTSHITDEQLQKGPGQVLLYYHYSQVTEPHIICAWQKALCEKLHLTGKVRVATEGINGMVGGTKVATDLYITAVRSHPIFKALEHEDFKTSDGGAECFSDLRVGVHKEIVPMGIDPKVVSYTQAGVHLEPEAFHREVEDLLSKDNSSSDTILLDCRNFYESKIGHFSRCLAPNIRKFSYFPDYVDKNLELFRDKRVLMYCTGGIRCERGSAYLRSKDVCKDVLQLKGGIHKYLERFPEGFYRGKLFVFDERYAISSNSDIISECRYCPSPWDQYQLCSSPSCCQLVLSCPTCRQTGHTSCCPTCQAKQSSATPFHREECECTDERPRIPQDSI
ncbi:thiosulfate sulfurtransferase/rhodanese-like domain-containing protein 2 [Aplochiton taeniatus]